MSERLPVHETQVIEIASIDVDPDTRRKLNEETVLSLMGSIREVGLKTPIEVVARKPKKGEPPRYTLAAGWHRLEAMTRLGQTDIRTTLLQRNTAAAEDDKAKDTPDRRAMIAKIEENFRRNDLTELEKALSHGQLKADYEAQYPNTAHGKAVKSTDSDSLIGASPIKGSVGYNLWASHQYGTSMKCLKRWAFIAKNLTEDSAARLTGTKWADHQACLAALAQLWQAQHEDGDVRSHGAELQTLAVTKLLSMDASGSWKQAISEARIQIAGEDQAGRDTGFSWGGFVSRFTKTWTGLEPAGRVAVLDAIPAETIPETWIEKHLQQNPKALERIAMAAGFERSKQDA